MTDLNETGRVSITAGMARSMIHGAARQCPGCKLGFPKYPGRYPKTCPRCKGDVPGPVRENAGVLADIIRLHDGWWSTYIRDHDEATYRQVEGYKIQFAKAVRALGNKAANRKVDSMLKWQSRGKRSKANDAYWMARSVLQKAGLAESEPGESAPTAPVVCVSRAQRIQKLIESGRQSFANYLKDDACSRVVTVSYSSIAEHCGGVEKLRQFFEGPVDCGFYYRVESREDPVFIAEFDDRNERARIFATSNPSRYLLVDPLGECVVEDHDATFEQTAQIEEGLIADMAAKVIDGLKKRASKLVRYGDQLKIVQDIWNDASREAAIPIPVTTEMRMAKGLRGDMRRAFPGPRVEGIDEVTMSKGEFTVKAAVGIGSFAGVGAVSADGVWGVEKGKGGVVLTHIPSGAGLGGYKKQSDAEKVVDALDAIPGADWKKYTTPKRIPKSVMDAAGKIVMPAMDRTVKAPERSRIESDKQDANGYVKAALKDLKAGIKYNLTEYRRDAANLYSSGKSAPPVGGQDVAWVDATSPEAYGFKRGDQTLLTALAKAMKPFKMKARARFQGAKTYTITIEWGAPKWDVRYQGAELAPAVAYTWSRAVGEGVVESDEHLDEALGLTSILGLFYAVVGGVPLLLGALAKAAKWLGFDKAHVALKKAHHVMHHIESRVVDYTVPDRLSYAAYKAAWKRGWRLAGYVAKNKRIDSDAPVSYDYFKSDKELKGIVDGTLYKMLLLYLATSGIAHLVSAPLSMLFAAEAAATGVKGIEIGQGLKKAAQVVTALESATPNLCMVALGSHGLYEAIPVTVAAAVELYPDEMSAMEEAEVLGLDMVPSRRLIGEEQLWALVHSGSGYALGRGESVRLREEFERDKILDEVYGSGPGAPSYSSLAYSLGRANARTRAVDGKHQRVAGEFRTEGDTRRSSRQPRKPGEGLTHPIQGFRFSTTKQRPGPQKDVQQAVQNKRNAKRGGNNPHKIRKHKEWHRGREGRKYHRAQAEFNKQQRQRLAASADDVRNKIMDVKDRILRYSSTQQRGMGLPHLGEDVGTMRPRSSGGTDQMSGHGPMNAQQPSVDDDFEMLLRRLIVTQDMDVLSDVEFDDESGAVYLFFDPILRGDEIDELTASLKQAKGEIELIASPNMSLPNEQVESDWWVFFLPGIGEDVAAPDPSFYARSPENYGTRVQMVVMGQGTDVEQIAQNVDISKMLDAAGN